MITHKFLFIKKRIGIGVMFFLAQIAVSIWFIKDPEVFIRNFLMKEIHIQTIGVIMFMYSSLMMYALIALLFRNKAAFVISDSYLIDNSKFESVGKIHLSEISKIERLKKNSLKITLKEPVFKSKRLNVLKKIVHIVSNWSYKNSIIISSALLRDCDIKTLEKVILSAMKKYNSVNKNQKKQSS